MCSRLPGKQAGRRARDPRPHGTVPLPPRPAQRLCFPCSPLGGYVPLRAAAHRAGFVPSRPTPSGQQLDDAAAPEFVPPVPFAPVRCGPARIAAAPGAALLETFRAAPRLAPTPGHGRVTSRPARRVISTCGAPCRPDVRCDGVDTSNSGYGRCRRRHGRGGVSQRHRCSVKSRIFTMAGHWVCWDHGPRKSSSVLVSAVVLV